MSQFNYSHPLFMGQTMGIYVILYIMKNETTVFRYLHVRGLSITIYSSELEWLRFHCSPMMLLSCPLMPPPLFKNHVIELFWKDPSILKALMQ